MDSWNSEKGKILKRMVISFLIFTLTFANILFLMPYILESYAIDIQLQDQSEATDNANVSFKATFQEMDEEGNVKEVYEINKTTEEELNLYVTIRALEGYLTDVEIDFQDSNFVYTETGEQKVSLRQINEGEVPTFSIPVKVKKSSEFELGLLNTISNVSFTGMYISGNEKAIVSSTKQVNINWIQNEEIGAEVTQNIITNKVYKIGEEEKRIIQVEVESKLINSQYPIKINNIEIQAPEIEGLNLEEVNVIGKGNLATNGKEIFQENWEYNQETKTININVENIANEEGKISWIEGTDKFIITYVYDNNIGVTNLQTTATNKITLQNEVEINAEANILNIENPEELGNVMTLNTKTSSELYKGYMYIGEETEYPLLNEAFITYLNTSENIQINNTKSTIEGRELEESFTKTYFNKEQIINILGEDGVITIYNKENLETPIKTIKVSEELLKQEEIIIVEYEEEISNLTIETTKPIATGELEILNYRKVKLLGELSKEEIMSIKELTVNANLTANDIVIDNAKTIQLLEPTTSFEVSTDIENITATKEENLRITTVLKTSTPEYNLFKNPVIEIELPIEIETAEIENISLLYDEEIEIENREITVGENGNKIIKVTLSGEQTQFRTTEATIVIDAKVTANKLTTNRNVELKATCINNEEKININKEMKIVNSIGILNNTTLEVGENSTAVINEKAITSSIEVGQTATYTSNFINNYTGNIENLKIVGTMPQNEEGKVTSFITSQISTNLENVEILYTTDLENWETKIEDYSQIKAFEIKVKDIITQGQQIDLQFAMQGKGEIEITITGDLSGRNVKNIFTIKLNQTSVWQLSKIAVIDGVILSVEPQVLSDTYHVGQIVTYKVIATNNGESAIKNANLVFAIPEKAVYTELTYAQGPDITYTDDINKTEEIWNIENLGIGETITKEITIKLIQEGISTYSLLLKQQETIIAQTEQKEINIVPSKVTVYMSTKSNLISTLNNNNKLNYVFIVKNTSDEEIRNATINTQLPEHTKYFEDKEDKNIWKYNEETNKYYYNIETLAPGEEKIIRYFNTKVDTQNKISSAIISNYYTLTFDDETYQSNIYNMKIEAPIYEIHQTIEHNEQIKNEEVLKYIITVTNKGKSGSAVTIKDSLPDDIRAFAKKCYIGDKEANKYPLETNDFLLVQPIGEGETLTIEIEAISNKLKSNEQNIVARNIAEIVTGDINIKSEETLTTIINPEYINLKNTLEEPEKVEEPKRIEIPEKQEVSEQYSISGVAWLDENENGTREQNEKLLPGVKVYLMDKDGKVILEDGNPVYTLTSITGTYKFNNLKQAEYMLSFEYDADKYSVTKYQIEGAEKSNNSDVISKDILIQEQTKTVGVTNKIVIYKGDIENIDIGLINSAKFDLSLNKYISKLVVANKGGTRTYNYTKTDLAKTEILAKYLEGTSLIMEYEFKITNEGTIEGYVTDLVDYLPKKLNFNSELNPDWYIGTDGYLHNISLTEEAINIGETKTVKLILTKILEEDETGLITNVAEIGKSSNIKGIEEIDSIVGNKKDGEDDLGTVDVLISLTTGGTALYIVIIISCMLFMRRKYLLNKQKDLE